MRYPISAIESFVSKHLFALPLADTGRNSYGVLWFKWLAPCAELEALWLSVSRRELVLSCKLAHTHFSRARYFPKKLTNLKLKRRIAREAVAEASRFLRGEIVVVVERNEDGAVGSAMWCRKNQVPDAIAQSQSMVGASKTYEAWSWSGVIET